ncbi:glycine cleavage system H protein [Desulfosporosinus orientis DSM 765]|uniref:Glycine cleavage system H protein n=1 Tax=Desulfosporosinus orientis (strain ATCC 19365 / DSM 765 / NCIMB 8382 / VKM B-1628 / Singapore I) TaxID=768706 RepID=G7WEM1_DESOD|nr:glycine cleavage system protein GcvH [Desulfosporosinus orientis]AET66912.1 glycine cleavage system H protein [Desulfosporosinus orientis DSM 765]
MAQTKKTIDELNYDEQISYYPEHTWVRVEEDTMTIGISDYAQDQLGDVLFVELPAVGDEFQRGESFGQAESAKTVSSLIMPLSGKVTAVNEALEDDPELLNKNPYLEGWIITIEAKDQTELEELLTWQQYKELLQNQA